MFEQAQCTAINDGRTLRPEIRPYRHCYQSCFGCVPSAFLPSCGFKLGMHYATNEYNIDAMWYIAGPCAGGYCCAHEVCNTCCETRCSRRLSKGGSVEGGAAPPAEHAPGEGPEVVETSEEHVMSVDEFEVLFADWLDEPDQEGAPYEGAPRHEELKQQRATRLLQSDSRRRTSSASDSRRRSSSTPSCQQVCHSCQCRCVAPVYDRLCSIRCAVHWRSFVPLRIVVLEPAIGFRPEGEATDADADASAALEHMLSVNQTSDAAQGIGDRIDGSATGCGEDGHDACVEMPHDLKPLASPWQEGEVDVPDPAGADAGISTSDELWARTVVVEYDHGASHSSATANLRRPEMAPGQTSVCYFDPWVRDQGLVIPSTELAFESEMGYSAWKWVLFSLPLAGFIAALLALAVSQFSPETYDRVYQRLA